MNNNRCRAHTQTSSQNWRPTQGRLGEERKKWIGIEGLVTHESLYYYANADWHFMLSISTTFSLIFPCLLSDLTRSLLELFALIFSTSWAKPSSFLYSTLLLQLHFTLSGVNCWLSAELRQFLPGQWSIARFCYREHAKVTRSSKAYCYQTKTQDIWKFVEFINARIFDLIRNLQIRKSTLNTRQITFYNIRGNSAASIFGG